jgi:hypothetical protein
MFEHRTNLLGFRPITVVVCLALFAGCRSNVSDTTPSQAPASVSGPSESSAPATSSPAATAPPTSTLAVAVTPTNLTATSGNATVALAWTPSSGATSYNIKRSTTAGGPYVLVAAATPPSYTDTTVSNGTTYYYVVCAVNAAGQSANSAQISASPVAPTVAGTGVVLTPTVPIAAFGGTVQFVAVVTGSPGTTIAWSIQETGNVGTITSNGLYTAPMVAGTYHVVATSSANTKLVATATVTVTAPQGTPPALVQGVWQNITPPAAGFASTYGSSAVEISPVDPNVIYVPIDTLGLWRTTDRGSTWTRLGVQSTYQYNGQTTYLDSPVRVQVDPGDANHLIATQGVRGTTIGFWESHDAGNTWVMPPGFVTAAQNATADVTSMAVDPTNFKHILLGSHSPWANSQTAGIMETTDGGQTWILHPGDPSWPVGSVGISFLYNPTSGEGNANTWLVATDGVGFWRTSDAGNTWVKVANFNAPHGGVQIYYAKDGTLYSGGAPYPARSHDNGATWVELQNGLSNWYYYTIWGDGDTLYTQVAFTGTNMLGSPAPYMTAAEATDGPWTPYQGGAQTFSDGPAMMRYDAANQIMYSANWTNGLWALKVIKP